MDEYFGKLTYSAVSEYGFDDGIVLPSSKSGCEFGNMPSSVSGFEFDDGIVLPILEQSPEKYNFAPFYNVSSGVDFLDEHESYPMLRYVNQILMEENGDEQPSTAHDLPSLQAAEKSFYEVLGKKYPPSPHQPSIDQRAESSDSSTKSSSQHGTDCGTSSSYIDSQPIIDSHKTFGEQNHPLDNSFESTLGTSTLKPLNPLKNFSNNSYREVDSFPNTGLISSMFNDSEMFKRGYEEGSKFLPTSKQLMIDLDKYSFPSTLDNEATSLAAKEKKDEGENSVNSLRGRKHEHQDDSDLDIGRSNKQSAVSLEEVELSEALDRALLYGHAGGSFAYGNVNVKLPSKVDKILEQNGSLQRTHSGENPAKKAATDTETLDLSRLLTTCSQSVAANDFRTANEQLKLITHRASCTGDPHQRLAFLFANALEARLTGTGAQLYAALAPKRLISAQALRAFRVFLCAPFIQIYSFFTTKMILDSASKAAILHIVDFGINYGFQWPNLIKHLSNRPGGPPKLRITGIDLPGPGFRPAERVEMTGRRLAKYCERFHVPFEYQAIAERNWERINIEDLNLTRSEVLAVNCQFWFKILLDETMEDQSPRDAVLSLIRKMKPDIFLNDVTSAQLGSPFFITRFREALIYVSTVLDLLDNILPREDPQRLIFEQDFLGTEVMNVIACEGSTRVERAETYKQWQVRYERAGFRLLPLNQDLVKELRSKVKKGYHKDFVLDENGYWMLQGWKGKIITASSCWIPA